ncbi:MAG TPA: carboxypeptidase-like regulatory domain-containing protein, partial [Candidatus Acidoferrales bacterium]
MNKAAFYSALVLLVFASHLTMPTDLRAQAQASTGQIVGTVTDASGGVIPGAKVTIANVDTGLKRELTTNDAGQYRAVLLPTGRYEVSVEAGGFATAKQRDIILNVGSVVQANFTMQVGAVAQTIEVTAGGLESIRSETGTMVNITAIEHLPINGRRFHDFITANPTVLVEPQRNQISLSGQRGINSSINIDGADHNEPFFGGIRGGERSTQAFVIPQESIAEFQVTKQG